MVSMMTDLGVVKSLALLLLATLLAGCAVEAERDVAQAPVEIDDGWEVDSPARFDADLSLLDRMIRRTASGEYVNIHSILVVKDNVLVLEEYFDGHNRNSLHEIRSATKSIGSMLTGIAIDKGFLRSESERIHDYFENDYTPVGGWIDHSRKVEVRHLLSMMSGYDCDDLAGNFGCENAMYETNDWVQYSLNLPFAYPPGQHWAYNSSSLILVGEIVAQCSALKLDEFADRHLFNPIGVENFWWQFSPKGRAWIGGGARMIPREMAKIGLLMLNRGMWKGERLLSGEWIDKSTTKQGDMPGGVDYGYLWQCGWSYIGDEKTKAYWASGNGGQYIIVLPGHGMVVVFTGGNYNSPLADQPFRMLCQFILPAFLRPAPLGTVNLTEDQMEALAGVYHLDFEPSATSTISIHDDHLRLLSPDNESIDLAAHSTTFFTGKSQHGPVAVVFEQDDQGVPSRLNIYGSFQHFLFERR